MTKVAKKPQAVADLEAAIVRLVRAHPGMSRVALAKRLKLVPSTAGIYVDRLIERGFLCEAPLVEKPGTRRLGRPPIALGLNAQAGRFIGVDFDARQILAVAVDFAQRPLGEAKQTIPARASVERVLAIIGDVIESVAGARRRDLLGIGLGVPGPVDTARGVSLHYAYLRNWRDVPVGPHIAARFRVPTYVENNVRSMALAEQWSGQARGVRNLVCLGVRSGIGSGIVIDGRLLHGAHNAAGEIGRWIFPGAGSAGADGDDHLTIEDVASLNALLTASGAATVEELMKAAGEVSAGPDGRAALLVERAVLVHAWIVHQLAALFDPERIIVAGPLVEHDAYVASLFEAALAWGGTSLVERLRPSMLGPFAGAIGAAALAFQHWKPKR